jgi:flagellar basal-body rod protein FlgB
MLSGIGVLQVTGDSMRYLAERQTLIARNIANADTPGYKAVDLAPFTAASAPTTDGGTAGAEPVYLAQTNPAHLQVDGNTVATAPTVESEAQYGGEKPDGNTVSVEEQMIKSADVANAFAMASAVYTKSISIMKIAVDYGH